MIIHPLPGKENAFPYPTAVPAIKRVDKINIL